MTLVRLLLLSHDNDDDYDAKYDDADDDGDNDGDYDDDDDTTEVERLSGGSRTPLGHHKKCLERWQGRFGMQQDETRCYLGSNRGWAAAG